MPPIAGKDLLRKLYQLVGGLEKLNERAGENAHVSVYGFVHVALVREPDGGARITVEDSGPGIALESQTAIFQPYEQAGRLTARNIKGTGLGLAISKQFVEMHGGKIWLESEPGKGSRFILILPKVPPAPKPEEPAPDAELAA